MFSLFNLINFFCRFIDTPENGGLSGATLEEAKSWGKVGAKAKAVTVYCDATIALPVIVAAVRERIAGRATLGR
jgi:deoxyhypusine synthase